VHATGRPSSLLYPVAFQFNQNFSTNTFKTFFLFPKLRRKKKERKKKERKKKEGGGSGRKDKKEIKKEREE